MIALHSGGRAGGITPSKLSFKIVNRLPKHWGGVGIGPGVGVEVAVAVGVADGVGVTVGVGVGLGVGVTVGVGGPPCPYLIVTKSPLLVPVT